MESILDVQLTRLQTDHIDYYLIHGLMSIENWEKGKQIGVESFLENAKKSGKIRHIGFSYHGDKKQFKHIVDDYPWDFCQIQYNYFDENNQAGKEGLIYASSKGLGVVVMEPLRGGLLTGLFGNKIPKKARTLFNEAEVKKTPPEWCLRWVWDHPEVSVALSGMNEESHIEENIRIANTAYPKSLSNDDLKIISDVKKIFDNIIKISCTGCGYCMPCPQGVNIPLCFNLYNDYYVFGFMPKIMYIMFSILTSRQENKPFHASRCINCGKCESNCPQGFPIRKYLKEVSRKMEPFYFNFLVRVLSRSKTVLDMSEAKVLKPDGTQKKAENVK